MQRFDWATRTWSEVPDPEPTKPRYSHQKSLEWKPDTGCQACGSKDVTPLEHESWSAKYTCRTCGSEHEVTFVDHMSGAHLDTLEWSAPLRGMGKGE